MTLEDPTLRDYAEKFEEARQIAQSKTSSALMALTTGCASGYVVVLRNKEKILTRFPKVAVFAGSIMCGMTCYIYAYTSALRSSITKTLGSYGYDFPPNEEQKRYITEYRAMQKIKERNRDYQPAIDRLQHPQTYQQPQQPPKVSQPLPDSFRNPEDWDTNKFSDKQYGQNHVHNTEDLNQVDDNKSWEQNWNSKKPQSQTPKFKTWDEMDK